MIVENLVTNPSVESGSGTATVRQNLFANPAAGVDTTGYAAAYGTGGAGTLSRVTGVTGPTGTGITTAVRQVWTTAPTAGTTYVALGSPLTSTAAVVGGSTYHAGVFVRRITSVSVSYRARIFWFDSADAAISSVDSAAVLINPASTWVEIRVSGVAPANAVKAQLYALSTTAPFVVNDTMEFTGYICSVAPGYFDGGTPAVGDFTYSWTGTVGASVSTETAPSPTSLTAGSGSARVHSSAWAAGGSKSLRIIPTTGSASSFAYFAATGLTVGETYTAVGTIRLAAAQTGTLSADARGITTLADPTTYLVGFGKPANAAGVADVRATFVASATTAQIHYMNGAASGGGDVWWDNLALIAGTFTDPYFDGTTTSSDTITYTWTGTANASTSRKTTYLDGTNLTIGRFGTTIRVDDVTGWDEQGDRITVTGQTPHGSVPDALTLRQQLMGYVDSADETFVPVTWADQPQVNGYYRVVSADISPNPRAAFAGVYDFRVDLARVQGFTAPLIESVILGKLRTTTLSLTQRRTQSVPAGSRSYVEFYPDTGSLIPRALSVRRAGESSVLNVFSGAGDVMVGQFYLPPVKFYEGAATVTMGGRVVAGRQVQNTPSDWMIGNDIMQVEPVPGEDFAIRIRMWNVNAWSTWQTITFKWENPAVNPRKRLKFPHTITIMANSPEAATVRLLTTTGAASGGDYSPISVDFTIRRGSRTVAVYLRSVFEGEFAAEIAGFTSPTAITGGFSKTTSGITTLIGSAVTLGIDSSDVYSNQDQITAVDKFAFGVGLTNSLETAQTLLNEYFWAASEKQSVVAR